MEPTLQLSIPLTVSQIADVLHKQLPREERLRLAELLSADSDRESTKQEILDNLKLDYQALKQGTLVTRPIQELLDEL